MSIFLCTSVGVTRCIRTELLIHGLQVGHYSFVRPPWLERLVKELIHLFKRNRLRLW